VKKISIIIPVFNEEGFISRALESISAANSYGLLKEIIIIDDGSTDNTQAEILQAIKKLKKNTSNTYEIITHKKNEGKGSALRSGFLKSSGDIVIVQDADLEYNPSDYTILIEPFFKNNADVVYGSRFMSNRPHRVLYFWHYQVNLLLTTLSNILTNLNLTDMETGYKAFKGDLIRKLAQNLESNRFGFEPEITARIAKEKGIKIYEVGISYSGRTYEEGKKIGWKDGFKALWEIIKYNLF